MRAYGVHHVMLGAFGKALDHKQPSLVNFCQVGSLFSGQCSNRDRQYNLINSFGNIVHPLCQVHLDFSLAGILENAGRIGWLRTSTAEPPKYHRNFDAVDRKNIFRKALLGKA